MDNLKIIEKYKSTIMNLLPRQFPNLSYKEVEDAVDYSIDQHLTNGRATIYNNYKNKKIDISVVNLVEYILQREPILCASGVMFKNHADAPNPLIDLITEFLDTRKKYKKEMFKYPKGSEDFEKYNLLQLLKKIDVNGLYGALGNVNCILYNLHVAPSITTQARSCISSAGIQFEMFLANGVKFGSLNEVMTFIDNIIKEKDERKFNTQELGIREIGVDECFAKIILSCGFNFIPNKKQLQIIYDLLNRLDPEDITRIYYKNNLYEFSDNKYIQDLIIKILKTLKTPFINPNEPPEIILDDLNHLCDLMMEYVYYHHHIIDRIDKYNYMMRYVCCHTDTDSVILSVDPWFRYVLDKVKDIDMDLKHDMIDVIKHLKVDEFGDILDATPPYTRVEDDYDYNFYDDEVIQMKKKINPLKIIPQEGLRYSIVNIISYIIGKVVNDYMERYTKNTNSYRDDKPCVITMKNEFLFKRLLLTDAKKNYVTIQELQEGNVIKGGMLDVKGLQLTKSGTSANTEKRLKKILYEDILNAGDNIDFGVILKHLGLFEKDIIKAIKSGSKEFYKPLKLKNIDNYANPMSTSGVKECMVWNAIKDDGVEGFDLHEQNYMELAKVNINKTNIEEIKDEYPETYAKFIKLMEQEPFDKGINGIAIPKNVDVPKWIVKYVNYTSIVQDNIHLFPLGPLRIYRGNSNSNNYTNIVSL